MSYGILWDIRQTYTGIGRGVEPLSYHSESHQVVACQIRDIEVMTFKKLWRQIPLYWRNVFDFETERLLA